MSLEESQSVPSQENHVTRTVQPIRRRVADAVGQGGCLPYMWEKEGRVNGRDAGPLAPRGELT